MSGKRSVEVQLQMEAIFAVLGNLGVGVAANAVYDVLRSYAQAPSIPHRQQVEAEIDHVLRMHGVSVQASTVIDALAERGLLIIHGSDLYAPKEIVMGAEPGAEFRFGYDSQSRTDTTGIVASGGAEIRGRGAAIVQNEDGSISFKVGRKQSGDK